MKKLLFACILMCKCNNNPQEHLKRTQENQTVIDTLMYYKDVKTNMCFAGSRNLVYQYSALLTNVPCTPEVESLIKNNQ